MVIDETHNQSSTGKMSIPKGNTKMNEVVFGIDVFGHDASASIVNKYTGEVIYAVAEERLTNIKHDRHFPIGSINRCLEITKKNNLDIVDIAIDFDDLEFIKGTLSNQIRLILNDDNIAEQLITKIIDIYNTLYDYYYRDSFTARLIDNEINKFDIDKNKKKEIIKRISWYYNWGVKYKHVYQIIRDMFPDVKVHKIKHHIAHATSAFFNSGFDKATVITIDGQGESETITISIGDDSGLNLISKTMMPYSLGIFYLMATKHIGFELHDEYKVMGMAAYGDPKYYDILKEMMSVNDNAELLFHNTKYYKKHDMGNTGHFYFDFTDEFKAIVPKRDKDGKILQKHFDFAASVQKLTEEIGVDIAKKAIKLTNIKKIAIAGGVGLNGLLNEKIRRLSGCTDIFIYPASGDDGTSIGAAQYVAFRENNIKRQRIKTIFYGYQPENDEIKQVLNKKNISYNNPKSIHFEIAKALSENKVVARYFSRSEFGPRALGNRSILANPCNKDMKDILNSRIKHREPFRPFAPVCLRERVDEYFDINIDAPFMLLICNATEKAKKEIPAVVHNDGTCRIQTITLENNTDFYKIVQEFDRITGVPVLINTSFNVNGEAIVDTPLDAIDSFGFMDIDYLAIGDFWVSKDENIDKFPKLSHRGYLEIRRERFKQKHQEPLASLNLSNFPKYFYPNPTLKEILVEIKDYLNFKIFKKYP